MKFNWGTGIDLVYSLFVLALVVTVIRSTQYDNSLVSDHYYADDLAYQRHYDKLVNSQRLADDLTIGQNSGKTAVELQFPAGAGRVNGQIHFFCPSDSRQDFRVSIRTNAELRQVVSTHGLKAGLWRVKVDWSAGGKGYYKEEVIVI
jgi:hypothetical protein